MVSGSELVSNVRAGQSDYTKRLQAGEFVPEEYLKMAGTAAAGAGAYSIGLLLLGTVNLALSTGGPTALISQAAGGTGGQVVAGSAGAGALGKAAGFGGGLAAGIVGGEAREQLSAQLGLNEARISGLRSDIANPDTPDEAIPLLIEELTRSSNASVPSLTDFYIQSAQARRTKNITENAAKTPEAIRLQSIREADVGGVGDAVRLLGSGDVKSKIDTDKTNKTVTGKSGQDLYNDIKTAQVKAPEGEVERGLVLSPQTTELTPSQKAKPPKMTEANPVTLTPTQLSQTLEQSNETKTAQDLLKKRQLRRPL